MATLRGNMGGGQMRMWGPGIKPSRKVLDFSGVFADPYSQPIDLKMTGKIIPDFTKPQYVDSGRHASKLDRRDNAEMAQSTKKYKEVARRRALRAQGVGANRTAAATVQSAHFIELHSVFLIQRRPTGTVLTAALVPLSLGRTMTKCTLCGKITFRRGL